MFEKISNFLLRSNCQAFIHHSLFHTTPSVNKINHQLLKTFSKVGAKFGERPKKKKPFFTNPDVSQPDKAMKSVIEVKKSRFLRRENSLNKLFMSHITDIMATGDIFQDLVGKGIEISRVKISSDFQFLNVFWVGLGSEEDDDKIQAMLDNYAFSIRDYLTQLRVIGNVPKIFFIKDKFRNRITEINNILEKADYGEDFIPMYPSLLNTEFVKPSDPDVLNQMTLDDTGTMPPMRHDVFKLDHSKIMNKIKASVIKSKAFHRTKFGGLVINTPSTTPIDPIIQDKLDEESENQSNESTISYSEFIKNQKKQKAKLLKEKLAENISQEELWNKVKEEFNNNLDDDDDSEDDDDSYYYDEEEKDDFRDR